MRVYDGQQDVEIDIYATGEGLPDGPLPVAGDEIFGTLWLQGKLPPLE